MEERQSGRLRSESGLQALLDLRKVDRCKATEKKKKKIKSTNSEAQTMILLFWQKVGMGVTLRMGMPRQD